MVRPLKQALKAIAGVLPVATVCRLLSDARRSTEIPIVLCIDVEPDARVVDRGDPRPWRGFEQVMQRIPPLREGLSQATQAPVTFTWLIRMDPQVADTWGSPTWAVETYGGVFAELEGSGDELGLHTHLWRWDSETGDWIRDHDPAWGKHCVTMALDAFESAFGRNCTVHSGGDHSLSGEMLACLEARGVKTDLSVAPGASPQGLMVEGERASGLAPDYRGVPTEPYRSSPSRFPAPDPASHCDPLLVPLLSGPPLRGVWDSAIVPGAHPSLFAARLLRELLRGPPPVLAFALRTDPAHLRAWGTVVKNLEHLARHRGMRFVTASAAVDLLRPRSLERARVDTPGPGRDGCARTT